MDVKEYLLSLMAIVTGLAIADMIVSLHGLLRRFRKVHWDWLPVVAALFVFVLIVSSWWTGLRPLKWSIPYVGLRTRMDGAEHGQEASQARRDHRQAASG